MARSPQPEARPQAAKTPLKEALTVTDNRTGRTYEVPITDGTIRAIDLRQIKTGPDDFGLMTYDPAS
jgi:citrate synthase